MCVKINDLVEQYCCSDCFSTRIVESVFPYAVSMLFVSNMMDLVEQSAVINFLSVLAASAVLPFQCSAYQNELVNLNSIVLFTTFQSPLID